MEPTSAGLLAIIILVVLMFLSMPVGLSMILSGVIGLFLIMGPEAMIQIISFKVFSTATNHIFSLIPLFVLMGWFAAVTELSMDAFTFMEKWMRFIRGGIAMAVCWASAIFGAVCGSTMVSAVTFVPIALPAMRKAGYKDSLSLGAIAGGAQLAFLIPPSMGLIWYGILTQTSIAGLFMAGIIPGILLTTLFCIIIYVMCRINPSLAPAVRGKVSWRERFKIPVGGIALVLLVLVVLGSIYLGVCTPTEAGAIGAFGALVLGLVCRRLSWDRFKTAVLESGKTTAFILLLLMGAFILVPMTAASELPQAVSQWVTGAGLSRWVVLTGIIILYIFLGCFTDLLSFLIITLPIFFPVMVNMGFDPLWFGIIVVMVMCIGSLTPPIGIVVFVLSGAVKEVPIFTIFKGTLPFLLAMVILVIIMIIFPGIVTFLPNLMLK